MPMKIPGRPYCPLLHSSTITSNAVSVLLSPETRMQSVQIIYFLQVPLKLEAIHPFRNLHCKKGDWDLGKNCPLILNPGMASSGVTVHCLFQSRWSLPFPKREAFITAWIQLNPTTWHLQEALINQEEYRFKNTDDRTHSPNDPVHFLKSNRLKLFSDN